FNYLGRFEASDDADWSVVAEYGTGLDDTGSGMPMAHSIEVNGPGCRAVRSGRRRGGGPRRS
ncbi:hypothetical protein DLE01_10075, partial [Streptomyces sp. FT05W]